MTRAQVLATEAANPSEIRESSGESIVRYDSFRLGELACRVVYIFANDKLVRAKYVFDAAHLDTNDYIRDFGTLAPLPPIFCPRIRWLVRRSLRGISSCTRAGAKTAPRSRMV
jgi:hypothetical protein